MPRLDTATAVGPAANYASYLLRHRRLPGVFGVAILAASLALILLGQEARGAGGGDVAIYRAASAGESIFSTTTFDHDWDTTVREDATSFNLSSTTSVIELQAGHYAVMYGSMFTSTGGTDRSEIQSQLVLAGSDLPIGWSQGFIRRLGGADAAFTSGGGIIEVASDNDPLILRSFRTDSNGTATVIRKADTAGISLLKLPDWNFLRLSKTATQTGPVSTAFLDVTYDQQDEIDTYAFGHTSSSGDITLKVPGHYLVFANTYLAFPPSPPG